MNIDVTRKKLTRPQQIRLVPAQEIIEKGICSFCGRREARLSWDVEFLMLDEPEGDENPQLKSACDRCASTLNEFAEIAFGEWMSGAITFEAPYPYERISF